MPRRTSPIRLLLVALAVLALAVSAQSLDVVALRPAAAASGPPFVLRPGTQQVEVLQATPGSELRLLGPGDHVRTGTVDEQGSLVWRQLTPGSYVVQTADRSFTSDPQQVTGLGATPPPQSFYDGQSLHEGFNFITTRDGTTLSANVVFPKPPFDGGGAPYPTVVEYSGYDPSNPAYTTMSQIFTAMGYAYVGVNIRGTGCSGGSYLPFEPIQSLDGYDAIEAIAAQPWAKFHKVGMVGISYPAIEQLYVARTRPPHLAAITPLSIIDDSYRGTLWPGGILNTGFAEPWASARASDARPYGEGWERGMNSQECDDNQLVRLQNPDPVALIEDNPYYNKSYYEQIDPSRFVGRIDVPVYLAGAWQDEQTGGHFPAFLDRFRSSPQFYATMTNGSHTEALSLGEFQRYSDFIDLYVGRRVPTGIAAFIGPQVAAALTGVTGLSLPPGDSYLGLTYAQAKKKYESEPHIRVLFEEGAADGQPSGAPLPRFEHSFRSWPVPGADRVRWFLRPGGRLTAKPSRSRAPSRSFSADPSALPATDYTGSSNGIWAAHPSYDWRQIPKGTGLGWITAPMPRTSVVLGGGSLDVWVRTRAKDVDLEATVSDVRPDGSEVYVQSGWLRASHAKLAPSSTVLRPVHTDLRKDARPMPRGYRFLRIEIPAFAQPFRKGDRLRITLDAPGGAKPLWAFRTLDDGQRVWIGADRRRPSSFVLTTVPGIRVPASRPECGALRSQPCRTYPG